MSLYASTVWAQKRANETKIVLCARTVSKWHWNSSPQQWKCCHSYKFCSDASKVKFYQTKQKCCTRQKSSEWVHFRSWSIKLYRSKLNERKKLINLVVWLGFEFVCLFEFDLVLCLCVCVCGFYSLLTV